MDRDGDIYVADWNNDRLQVFDRDGNYLTQTTGEGTLSKWGTNKLDGGNPEMWEERRIAQGLDREKDFWGPIAVEVDDEGRIFVVESARSRIQIFRKQYPVFYGAGEKVAGWWRTPLGLSPNCCSISRRGCKLGTGPEIGPEDDLGAEGVSPGKGSEAVFSEE